MRPLSILSAVILLAAKPVLAQVTVDLHALQALPEHPGATQVPRAYVSVAPRAPAPGPTPAPAPASAPFPATATPPPAAVRPVLPDTAPETAMVTPIAPPPSVAPPPPPVVSDKATTTAAPTVAGLRLTFASGQSVLSPDSTASIKEIAAAAPSGDQTTFNVLAYAPGAPDDPSTARRVSLARAMAVRGALVADGIASARIFVRALGAQYGDGPPDRVDLNITSGNDTAGSK